MTGAHVTCTIPMLWSLGEACAALCARAERLGLEQRARFNAVVLIAAPADDPIQLAREYWICVSRELVSVDQLRRPELADYDPATAALADEAATAERLRLNGARRGEAGA